MKSLKIGIVGSGFMGQEIGKFLAELGYPILLKGRKVSDLKQFQQDTTKIYDKLRRFGKIKDDEYACRIANTRCTMEFDHQFNDLDLVIESVVEDIEVKKSTFRTLEECCGEQTLLCTNTSTLSIAEIATNVKKKDRVLGIHFFHPVKFAEFLEIIKTNDSAEHSLQSAYSFIRETGKKFLLVKDSPGFFLNRVMLVSLQEIFFAIESGWYTIEEIDALIKKSDFLYNPFTSSDMMGLDVLFHTMTYMSHKIPDRFYVPDSIATMVKMGRLGKKAGKGFYNYTQGNSIDEEMHAIVESYRSKRKNDPVPFSVEQCRIRIMNEALYCLQEGIATKEDVEAVISSVPSFGKGLFSHMDKIGLDVILQKTEEYERIFGKRFKASSLLVDMVKKGHYGVKSGRGLFSY